jgi:hypothetical protein
MVDTMKITTPAMSATDPIRSIGRSSSAGVLATIVRQLHKLPYYGCEAKCLTLNHGLLLLLLSAFNMKSVRPVTNYQIQTAKRAFS